MVRNVECSLKVPILAFDLIFVGEVKCVLRVSGVVLRLRWLCFGLILMYELFHNVLS